MKKILILASFVALVACDKSSQQNNPSPVEQTSPEPVPVPSSTPAPVPTKPTLEVQISSVGDQMKFDKTELTVSAGQPVHLVFNNKSHMTTMLHNWALVKSGTEASVAENGLFCQAKGSVRCPGGENYVNKTDSNLLAYTAQAKAGETVEITFTAPTEPGVYPYICTFPGHYMFMKGQLTVTQ